MTAKILRHTILGHLNQHGHERPEILTSLGRETEFPPQTGQIHQAVAIRRQAAGQCVCLHGDCDSRPNMPIVHGGVANTGTMAAEMPQPGCSFTSTRIPNSYERRSVRRIPLDLRCFVVVFVEAGA